MTAAPAAAQPNGGEPPRWSLMIHGGAGIIERARLDPDTEKAIRAALNRALDAGSAVLARGGTAVDAVEAAVLVLEDDPHFNAAKGAVLTHEGKVELDAAIMDGDGRRGGAVAQLSATRNPIKAARAVMDHSPHVMLAAGGADAFSREQGLAQVPNSYFETPERRRQLDELLARERSGERISAFDVDMKYGTVGAVARDLAGHVAAATSTGGITGKRWGRIGDSPILGAGTYADDRACAVSATGAGEFFIRVGVAHEICARMRFRHEDTAAAGAHVIAEVGRLGGTGGVIVMAPDGSAAWNYNTAGMYRARADASGARQVSIFGDEP